MKGRWFNESILISMLLATVNFYRCVVDCPIQCPAECVPILFKITQAGKNILDEPTPFKKQDMRVEVTPLTPEAPPLLGFDNDAFKLVVCHNGEYKLHLMILRLLQSWLSLILYHWIIAVPIFRQVLLNLMAKKFASTKMIAQAVHLKLIERSNQI